MSSSSPPAAASPATKRACDSCHRRKVKCLPLGEEAKPCRNCVAASLECTFFNKVQKKGPKGNRAKVLLELRETQQQQRLVQPATPSAAASVSPSSAAAAVAAATMNPRQESRSGSPSLSTFQRTPGILPPGALNACMAYYFTHLYPIFPIIHPRKVDYILTAMDVSTETYCGMIALCAYVFLRPASVLTAELLYLERYDNLSTSDRGKMLLEEAMRVRKGHEQSDNPEICTIYASFFLFRCQSALDRQDAAWIDLRQAVTFAHVLNLHKEESYMTGDPEDRFTKRNLFWTLFVAERVCAMRFRRPISLYDSIGLPNPDDEPETPSRLTGFVQLIKLYKLFDNKFFGPWNTRSRDDIPHGWLEGLQMHLSGVVPGYIDCMDISLVDIKFSLQWLRSLIWQLVMQNSTQQLAINNPHPYKYIVDIGHEVVDAYGNFPREPMEIHGIDLAEKIFDVACTLAQVIPQLVQYPLVYEARECLQQLAHILGSLTSSQPRLLAEMNETISEAFSGGMVANQQPPAAAGQMQPLAGPPPLPPEHAAAAAVAAQQQQQQHHHQQQQQMSMAPPPPTQQQMLGYADPSMRVADPMALAAAAAAAAQQGTMVAPVPVDPTQQHQGALYSGVMMQQQTAAVPQPFTEQPPSGHVPGVSGVNSDVKFYPSYAYHE